MQLTKVRIQNFRGLKDVTVPLNDTTYIIGENNSGKSSFIEAIKFGLTLSNDSAVQIEEYDFYRNSGSNSVNPIIIDFAFLEKDLDEDNPPRWMVGLFQIFRPAIQIEGVHTNNFELFYRVQCNYNSSSKAFHIDRYFLDSWNGNALSSPWNEDTYHMKFLNSIPFFYLSALRDAIDFFDIDAPYWSKFMRELSLPQKTIDDVRQVIHRTNKKLIKENNNISQMINVMSDIQKLLTMNRKNSVEIRPFPTDEWEIMSRSQLFMRGHGGIEALPLRKHGQGTQSMSILLLIQSFVEVMLSQAFSGAIEAIVALEEPEAHLHPQAIKNLNSQLTKMKCQKIISTHSPYLLQGENILPNIRLFRKNGTETKVHYINTSYGCQVTEESPHLQRLLIRANNKIQFDPSTLTIKTFYPLDEFEQKHLSGMYKRSSCHTEIENFCKESEHLLSPEENKKLLTFVQKTRGEIFFARTWVLAEGQTEYYMLQFFSEVLGISLKEHGVEIIDYQNNGSPGSFVNLAKLYNIPWLLLSDNDLQGISTVRQIKKAGYTQDEIDKLVVILTSKDFETFLLKNGFKEDYKRILGEKLNDITISPRQVRKYNKALLEIIQEDKVGNTLKLIEYYKANSISKRKIPILLRKFLKRSVELANEQP